MDRPGDDSNRVRTPRGSVAAGDFRASTSSYVSTGSYAPETEANKRPRFGEPQKFLPVAFVACTILSLYSIYMFFHIIPLLRLEVQSWTMTSEDFDSRHRGRWQVLVFHYFTALLLICYLRSILVHPGEIPDNNPQWEYIYDGHVGSAYAEMSFQEKKRTGERRHCKWCGKYKPDRCHHCRVCRTCILKMDHHCPWIYNCVGFKNYKFFFLLLLYAVLDTHLILWTMAESVKTCIDEITTPFLTMFLVFFGWTLALFIAMLLTVFFCFHIGLMLKAMTTIEFCEKTKPKPKDGECMTCSFECETSGYNLGIFGNIRAVLGDNVLLWFFPCAVKEGDGLNFVCEESRLTKDIESSKGRRLTTHQRTQRPPRSGQDSVDRRGGKDRYESKW